MIKIQINFSITEQNDECIFIKWLNGNVTSQKLLDSSVSRKIICLFSSKDSKQSLELNLHAIGYFFSSMVNNFLFIKYMPSSTRFFTQTPILPFYVGYIILWCIYCMRFIRVMFITFFVWNFRVSRLNLYLSSSIF